MLENINKKTELKLIQIKFTDYKEPFYMVSSNEDYYINDGVNRGRETKKRKIIKSLEPTINNKLSYICFLFYTKMNYNYRFKEDFELYITDWGISSRDYIKKSLFDINEIDNCWNKKSEYISLDEWEEIADFNKSFDKFKNMIFLLLEKSEKEKERIENKILVGKDFLSKIETLSKIA